MMRKSTSALFACAVISAVTAASASAALPEITVPGSSKELTKKSIKVKGGANTFELAGGSIFTCTGYAATGSVLGTKKVSNTLVRYTGCKSSGFACQSAGAPPTKS